MSKDFQQIGALWKRVGRNGKYLQGRLNEGIDAGDVVFVFVNERKREENHPDYNLFVKRAQGRKRRR